MSRRDLLKYLGAVAALTQVSPVLARGVVRPVQLGPVRRAFGATCTPSIVAIVERRDDMLALRFEFFNLRLQQGAGSSSLVRINNVQPAFVVVHFQPQSFAEQAFPNDTPPFPSPVRSLLSGESRLAFRVPDSTTEIPYELDELLGWLAFEPSLVPVADGPDSGPAGFFSSSSADTKEIRKPGCTETSIEAPFRLMISPRENAAWAHRTTPATRNGVSELWHTRLGTKVALTSTTFVHEADGPHRTVRAVWSPDYRAAGRPGPAPFLSSLTPGQRHDIVRLTSDYVDPDLPTAPVRAHGLMLSALGAWLDFHGRWEKDPEALHFPVTAKEAVAVNVEEWTHRAAMGRDNYVRVVEKGFLLPFGLPASLTTITERVFRFGKAYLRQRRFVIVRNPVQIFDDAGGHAPDAGRRMPFQSLTLGLRVTPDLDIPGERLSTEVNAEDAFWLDVDRRELRVPYVAVDRAGKAVDFTGSVAFIKSTIAYDAQQMTSVRTGYNNSPRRITDLWGQSVSIAESVRPGDTELEISQIVFRLEEPAKDVSSGGAYPAAFPAMQVAKAKIPGLDNVGARAQPSYVKLGRKYLLEGFDGANDTSPAVFAELTTGLGNAVVPIPLSFDAGETSGAIAKPNMPLAALSRNFGPVGAKDQAALDQFTSGEFVPGQFFEGAKLLGNISLADILAATDIDSGDGRKVPKVVTRLEYPDGDRNKPPVRSVGTLDWKPDLQSSGVFIKRDDTQMEVKGLFVTDFERPSDSTFEVRGRLEKFALGLLSGADPFLTLDFDYLVFTASKGVKPGLDAKISEVTFSGELEFVNQLRTLLASVGEGFAVDVQPSGVTIRAGLELPKINVGAFSLENIAIAFEMELPFNGEPFRMRFAFCTKANPFIVTYSCLGGGGYVDILISGAQIEKIEISIEIGAYLSFSIAGVASGNVEASAALTIRFENDHTVLTGSVDICGSLEFLGVVSLSVSFHLELSYDTASGYARGQASFTVHIDVAILTKDVSFTVEEEFRGSDPSSAAALESRNQAVMMPDYGPQATGDPRAFATLVPPESWDEYCNSFAGA